MYMVEWKSIGSVCKTVSPPKKLERELYSNEGQYPIIDQGQKDVVGYTDDVSALVPDGVYVLFGDHTRYVKYHNGRFAQGADGLKILKPLDSVLPRFFFYAFDNIEVPSRGYSRHWSIAKDLFIPIPSLPEQNRIVEILDTFTSSIENLKQQIAERRKQYEHYRDLLLDLEGKEGVEMKKLGDICDTLSGFPFDSTQFSETGIRLMRGMNVKRGFFDFSEENNKYWNNSIGLEKYLLEVNDIIVSMDGSLVGCSFCYLKKEHLPLLLVQRVARIRTKENYKYIYHNLAMRFPDYVNKKKTAGAIPHISMKDINSFVIPVPSLQEQYRIASILDTFEASIANLEAQLSQREKQYEYYRNKLLIFE
jgi:type I restriction enzyme S subunit